VREGGPRTRGLYNIGNQGGTMVTQFVIYRQLSHNRFPMDGVRVGCGRFRGWCCRRGELFCCAEAHVNPKPKKKGGMII
jgi:hypothetical protein